MKTPLGATGCIATIFVLATAASLNADAEFARHFTAKTMRVDYYHGGTAAEEHIALDQVVSDGPWAGSRTTLVDTLNRGLYSFEMRDQATNRVLYSRGFCSVFGEWQTTSVAKERWGAFHESLRFPWPKKKVQVILKRRDSGLWREIWTTVIDPASRFVNKADVPGSENVWTVFDNGPPAEKVDILFLGDGYTRKEMKKYHAAVHRLAEHLFTEEPFRSRRRDFNVRAVDTPAEVSGISRPRAGVFRRSPLRCQYNTFDSQRYVLTFANRTLRDTASGAPYDYLVILLNSTQYGGGGIYNDQTTVAAGNAFADYILVHEFGHHMAGLGDEYYTSDVAYETGGPAKHEPWEPNVTALLNPTQLKWRDLIETDVPLPTPWNKDDYEATKKRLQQERKSRQRADATDRELDAIFHKEREIVTRLLADNPFAGRVGAFEGAGYEATGLYRPTVDCLMFSRDRVGFCPVCRRAIQKVIDQHVAR